MNEEYIDVRYKKSLETMEQALLLLNKRCNSLQEQILTITETSKLLFQNIELQADMIKLLMKRR